MHVFATKIELGSGAAKASTSGTAFVCRMGGQLKMVASKNINNNQWPGEPPLGLRPSSEAAAHLVYSVRILARIFALDNLCLSFAAAILHPPPSLFFSLLS